jgi:hypothetical protein
MTALARTSSNCKRQTHPLVRWGCYIRTMTASVQLRKRNYWSWVSRGLSPRRTDWQWTDSREVTLTLKTDPYSALCVLSIDKTASSRAHLTTCYTISSWQQQSWEICHPMWQWRVSGKLSASISVRSHCGELTIFKLRYVGNLWGWEGGPCHLLA